MQPPTNPEPPRRTDPSIVATLAAVKNSTDPYASRERHHNEGHGRRLTAAFEALEAFPMLAESRNRVLRLFEQGQGPAPLVDLLRCKLMRGFQNVAALARRKI